MDERSIPRCFRTLISDKASDSDRGFIGRFIAVCTGCKYSMVVIRWLDATSIIAAIDIITTEKTYSVIRSQLSDLLPGLCIFNAVIM